MSKSIAEKINRFKAYVGSVESTNELVGITDEVTLPTFEFMSETLSLAGMVGELDSPSPGQFKSCQMEITFSNISEEGMAAASDDSKTITLRAAQEQLDTESLGKSFVQREITVKGMTKEINLGKLKKGGYGNPSLKKEIVYYKDKLGDKTLIEVDKINGKWVVNDKNMMKYIESML